MRTIHFFMAVLVAATAASAQGFGLRAGLNLGQIGTTYDYSGSEGGYYYSQTANFMNLTGNLIGFHVGAVVDVKILEFLYFQPGVMLSSKGGETKKEYEDRGPGGSRSYEESTETFTPYYIDVPLMLSLKGTLANDLALRVNAGPYLGFGLFGKYEYKYIDSDYPEDNHNIEVKNLFSPSATEKQYFSGFNKFNFGIGFGAGIEYTSLYFGITYNLGLTNLMDNEKGLELYERTFGFTLGYNF